MSIAYPVAEVVWGVAAAVGFGGLGAVLAARRPRLAAGWVMLVIGASGAASAVSSALAHALLPGSATGSVAYWLSTWTWVPSYVAASSWLLMVVPSGRLPGGLWRWALRLAVTVTVLTPLAWAVTPYAEQDTPVPEGYGPLTNPVGIPGAWTFTSLLLPLVLVSALLGVASVVVRVRRSTGRERDQVVYVLTGAVAAVALVLLGAALDAHVAFIAAAMFPLPLAMTAAALRRNLWDLDPVVNKTLVLVALSGAVVLVYAVLVDVAGGLLGRITPVPDVVALVLAAIAVQPLREVLQRGVNRLLYGDTVAPHEAVTRLGQRLEAATHPGDVLPGIVDVVSRTLRVPYVALEVPGHPVVRHGEPVRDVETIPLVHQRHDVGRLVVARPDDGLGRRRLLDELVRQSALAAHALHLQSELQASRERIVTSREEERRRMRHDLHDDLGPGLAATAMELERAAGLVDRDPDKAKQVLGTAADYLRGTVGVVRRIVDDLRPGALDDFGLEGALREHAGRLAENGLAVTFESKGALDDLPAAVEVAAFRIAAEAMTNVARHAAARTLQVVLDRAEDHLDITVTDDGAGLVPGSRPRVGLTSMHQRATELGGRCVLHSAPGRGTRVTAFLPTASLEPTT